MKQTLIAALLAVALAAPVAAGELAGVSMPDTATVGGKQLVLNGMAIRKKFFIKVYVAGLYLAEKSTSADAVFAADAPRRGVMHFVYGVGKGKICDGWDEGLEANTPNASAELKGQFKTLCSYMDDVKDGEEVVFTYQPESGTEIEVKGQSKGTIAGKPFADALFACWIGPDPDPGQDFKKALLGG
jgi:Chalcone isomerase-like